MHLESLQKSMLEGIVGISIGKVPEDLSKHLEFEHRFHIYQSGYRARILAAIEETFPRTLAVISQSLYSDFVEDFMDHSRFSSFDLLGICDAFPEFVDSFQKWTDLPYLSDLAAAEFQCVKSFHKACRPIKTFADIVTELRSNPSALKLPLQPYVMIFASKINIVVTTKRIASGKSYDASSDFEETSQEMYHHLIYRQDGQTRIESISNLQAEFINSLLKTPGFMEACESLDQFMQGAGRQEADVVPLADWLKTWAEKGMFVNEVKYEFEK
ncbi:MAG: putative DNA-binding domain-containing protein [Oligoflexales bacterium]